MKRFICSILVAVTTCLTSAFYFDANAGGISHLPKVIKALSRPPYDALVMEQASETPIGIVLSPSVLKKEWSVNTNFQVEVLNQLRMQDANALERLVSGTGQLNGTELARLFKEIEEAAAIHALDAPLVEVRPVDSIEFLQAYERIKKNGATRGCKMTAEICVGNDKTMSFSFGCGGANVQLTTAGQVSLTALLPDGEKYSVPIISEP